MSIATNSMLAFHASSRLSSHSVTGFAARPLTCTNNPPVSAVAITASWQVFHVHPCAAPTAFTERSSSRTANAISRLARTVTRARGGTDGVDSVNAVSYTHLRA